VQALNRVRDFVMSTAGRRVAMQEEPRVAAGASGSAPIAPSAQPAAPSRPATPRAGDLTIHQPEPVARPALAVHQPESVAHKSSGEPASRRPEPSPLDDARARKRRHP
jgi:hypothetical protein